MMIQSIKSLAVLIVEDAESDAQLIVRLLKKADYELVYEQVETAEQMRSALNRRAWDVVISDYHLPQFDGHAALKLLQSMGLDIPFIVVSGAIGEETAVAMMKAGAHDYLIKGSLARLVPAVERELAQAEIRRGRQRTEEALRESEDRYRTLVEFSPDSIGIHCEGKVAYVNAATVKLFHANSPEDLIGLPIIQFVHPDYRAVAMERARQSYENHLPASLLEEKFITLDGQLIDVEVIATPIAYESKPATQIIIRDITKRKRAEESLRVSEKRYRELFNGMIDGFALHEIICDDNGKPINYRFLEINPAFERLTGLNASTTIGKTVLDVLPNTEPYWIEIYGSVALTGQSAFFENYSGKPGRSFEVSVYCPQPGQFAVIMVDITGRTRAEDEIRKRVIELEMLYESGLALSQLLNPKAIGQKILELLENKLGWHHTRIRLYHPGEDHLELLDFNQPGLTDEMERRDMMEHFQTLITRANQGLSGWVIQHRQPVRSGNVSADPRYVEAYPGIQSGLYVPMKLGERIVGVISIEDEQPDAFSEADERLIVTLANQAASAFENARLFDVTRQRMIELETLNRLSIALRAVSTQEELLTIVLEEALYALAAESGSIHLTDEGGDLQKMIARGWLSKLNEADLKASENILQNVFTSHKTYVTRDFATDPLTTRSGTRGKLPGGWGGACVPIRSTKRILGVILIAVPGERELGDDEIRMLNTLAEMSGAALHRMRLFNETARRAEEFAALYETSNALSAENELNALLQTIVENAATLLNSSSCGIYFYDAEHDELEVAVDTSSFNAIGKRLKPGEGVAGRVAQSRQPMRIDDYSTWEDRAPQYEGIPLRAVLEVPMLYAGELIGVLTADETGDSQRKFTEADERLLSLFASQAAGAIHSARLFEKTARSLNHLQALRKIDRAISSSFDLHPILNTVVNHTITQLGVDAAAVLLFHPPLQTLEYAAGQGFRTAIAKSASVRLGSDFAGRVALERRVINISSAAMVPEKSNFATLWNSEGFESYYGVPLISKGEIKGVLEVFHRTPLPPNPEWLEFLETLAGQAAIAVDNTQLFDSLQKVNLEVVIAYDATIEGWSRALDLRDDATEGHTRRVTDLTVAFAKKLGIKDKEILHIRRGALLHDIGKMGIPDHILLKKEKLSGKEWEMMRRHPQLAYDMLYPIHYLNQSLDIPFCHHEKWDGSGYPRGLKGEQIPLAARVFALADVYDALTNQRPYRKAWTKAKALKYIREQSGIHFDPQIVGKFLEIFESE